MDDRQALNILMALGNGVHPFTGETFPGNSPYQLADVVRALFTAARLLEQRLLKCELDGLATPEVATISASNPAKSSFAKSSTEKSMSESSPSAAERETSAPQPPANKNLNADSTKRSNANNVGKPWTAEEDRQLLAAFDAEAPLLQIAKTHGRTQNGVRARLEKHGRLSPSNDSSNKRWQHSVKKDESEVRDGEPMI